VKNKTLSPSLSCFLLSSNPNKSTKPIPSLPSPHLCLPDALDSLSKADVVGLVLVEGKADNDSSGVQTPAEGLACPRHSVLGNVVNNDVLEAGVGVDEEGGAEGSVEDGVDGASGERREGNGDQGSGNETVKGPVVGAVAGIGWGDGGGVVDYLKVRGNESDEGSPPRASWVVECAHTCALNLFCEKESVSVGLGNRDAGYTRGRGGRRGRRAVVWKAVARAALAMMLFWKAGFVATADLGAEATCLSREERAIEAILELQWIGSTGRRGDWIGRRCFDFWGSTTATCGITGTGL